MVYELQPKIQEKDLHIWVHGETHTPPPPGNWYYFYFFDKWFDTIDISSSDSYRLLENCILIRGNQLNR